MSVSFFQWLKASHESAREAKRNPDERNKAPETKLYFLQAVLWPFFLLFRNPFTLFSETFFQYYGDRNLIYQGNTGLTNFLKDLFLGKNRYKDYICGSATVPVPPDSELAEKIEFTFEPTEEDKKKTYCVNIFFGVKGDKCLLQTICCEDDLIDHIEPSRFILDRSERHTRASFFKELRDLNEQVKMHIERLIINSEKEKERLKMKQELKK